MGGGRDRGRDPVKHRDESINWLQININNVNTKAIDIFLMGKTTNLVEHDII